MAAPSAVCKSTIEMNDAPNRNPSQNAHGRRRQTNADLQNDQDHSEAAEPRNAQNLSGFFKHHSRIIGYYSLISTGVSILVVLILVYNYQEQKTVTSDLTERRTRGMPPEYFVFQQLVQNRFERRTKSMQ